MEPYVNGMYYHVSINIYSNYYGPVSNRYLAVSNIPGNVNNDQVAVVSYMGQRLSVAVGTGIAIALDMRQILTPFTSNSHVVVVPDTEQKLTAATRKQSCCCWFRHCG